LKSVIDDSADDNGDNHQQPITPRRHRLHCDVPADQGVCTAWKADGPGRLAIARRHRCRRSAAMTVQQRSTATRPHANCRTLPSAAIRAGGKRRTPSTAA